MPEVRKFVRQERPYFDFGLAFHFSCRLTLAFVLRELSAGDSLARQPLSARSRRRSRAGKGLVQPENVLRSISAMNDLVDLELPFLNQRSR